MKVQRQKCEQALSKEVVNCSFASELRQFGFKPSEHPQADISAYTTADGKRYAEIQKFDGWTEVWVVGDGIPCNSTMSYPGGSRFIEPADLLALLKNCISR